MKWQIILSGKTSTVSLWRGEWDRSRRSGRPGSQDGEEMLLENASSTASALLLCISSFHLSTHLLLADFVSFLYPSAWPPAPSTSQLAEKCSVWLQRCDEIFNSSHKGGGAVIQGSVYCCCVYSTVQLWEDEGKEMRQGKDRESKGMGRPLALHCSCV